MLIDEDMSASDIHLVQDLLPEYYNGYTLGPMLEEIPFDEEFEIDMALGKGFIVTEKLDYEVKVGSLPVKYVLAINRTDKLFFFKFL